MEQCYISPWLEIIEIELESSLLNLSGSSSYPGGWTDEEEI